MTKMIKMPPENVLENDRVDKKVPEKIIEMTKKTLENDKVDRKYLYMTR